MTVLSKAVCESVQETYLLNAHPQPCYREGALWSHASAIRGQYRLIASALVARLDSSPLKNRNNRVQLIKMSQLTNQSDIMI